MRKSRNNEFGFSVIEVVLVFVIVVLVGVVGWTVYKHNHKTTKANTATTSTIKQAAPTTVSPSTQSTNPYTGWKTYNSILNSGLSFMYPPTWDFTPYTQAPTPNNFGGVENDSFVYSVAPTTSQGQYAAVSTNVFMCVDFDEYSSNGMNWQRNWNPGTVISSQQIVINGQNLTLATFKGATPMQDVIYLFNPHDTQQYSGYFISTKNGYIVSVSAQFNCQQGGFPAGTNLNTDFNSQPETATAKLIMESLKF